MASRTSTATLRFAPLALAAALAGCGSGWRAPEPEPPLQPPPPRAETRPPPPRATPPPDRAPAAPAPLAAPAPAPRAVTAESHYPVPRIWEWTLSNGMHVLFRRSEGEPGRVLLRAWAPGGWIGTIGGRPGDLVTGDGKLRLSLHAGESVVEGETWRRDLPAFLESLAVVLSGRAGGEPVLSTQSALDAAFSGALPSEGISPRSVAARFGRPGSFHVLFAGDVMPDTLISLAGAILGRVRPAAEAFLFADSAATAAHGPARTVQHPGDGQGRGALVGFRGVPAGPTADRAPEDVRAGLDVLAYALAAALEAEGLPARARVGWDGREATLLVDVREGDPEDLARDVLRIARALDLTQQVVARARVAALDAHNRAVLTPAGWIEWLTFVTTIPFDPRAAHHYPATLRAVPVERVRVLAEALFDPTRAAIVEIGDD